MTKFLESHLEKVKTLFSGGKGKRRKVCSLSYQPALCLLSFVFLSRNMYFKIKGDFSPIPCQISKEALYTLMASDSQATWISSRHFPRLRKNKKKKFKKGIGEVFFLFIYNFRKVPLFLMKMKVPLLFLALDFSFSTFNQIHIQQFMTQCWPRNGYVSLEMVINCFN